jgi:streptogramin lyase
MPSIKEITMGTSSKSSFLAPVLLKTYHLASSVSSRARLALALPLIFAGAFMLTAAARADAADVFVADCVNNSIVRVNTSTGAQTPVSSGGLISCGSGVIFGPGGILYVGSNINDTILTVDPNTGMQTPVTSGNLLDGPVGMTFASDGNLYVANSNNSNIVRVVPGTGAQTLVTTLPGNGFDLVLAPDGNLYATSLSTDEVIRISNPTGSATATVFSPPPATTNLLDGPRGIIFGPDGNLYVTNQNNNNLVRIDPTTGSQTLVTSGGFINFPGGLTLGNDGFLYIANGSGGNVLRIDPISGTQAVVSSGNLLSFPVDIQFQGGTPTAPDSQLAGRVTTRDGAPLAGVIVQLSGAKSARTITDSGGNYSFEHLKTGGFYTVSPAIVNFSFSPHELSFSLLADKMDAVFTATPDAVQTANPLDTEMFFVRQHYLDFLGREPDAGGLAYWTDQFSICGDDAECVRQRRIGISAAFFIETEFQQTGSFVYRMYQAALGRQLSYAEFSSDRQLVIDGANVEASRTAFADAFVRRAEFVQMYQGATSAESFVSALLQTIRQTSGVDLSGQRDVLIAKYREGSDINQSRRLVVREVIENAAFKQAVYNPSFVLMEYFGYLRRDPDRGGYEFWLNVLNNAVPNNYRSMVCAFITSSEYQKRFSSVVTHSNRECGD